VDNLEKVIIGLVLFAVTSIVAYLFRMRQLYVASPKLFRHAPISKNGSLCELIVYNKGNQVEENILVELDPELKGELLASSSSDISFERSTMKIERLHKGEEASAMLLIENGLLDATKIITVSSKGTKGRVLKKVSDVPPNYAMAFLALAFSLGIFPMMIYGTRTYEKLHSEYVEYKLKPSYLLGWKDLSRYYGSDLRASYSDQEFPIRFLHREFDGKKKSFLVFEVYNKTAAPLEVTVNKVGNPPGDIGNFASVDLQAMSKNSFKVLEPEAINSSEPVLFEFSLKSGEEFIYGLQYAAAPK
jgi:hypothetical protein